MDYKADFGWFKRKILSRRKSPNGREKEAMDIFSKAIKANPIYEEYVNCQIKDLFHIKFDHFYTIPFGVSPKSDGNFEGLRKDNTISFDQFKNYTSEKYIKSYSEIKDLSVFNEFSPSNSWFDIKNCLDYLVGRFKSELLIYDLFNCDNSFHKGSLFCQFKGLDNLQEYMRTSPYNVPLIILDKGLNFCIYTPIGADYCYYIIAVKENINTLSKMGLIEIDAGFAFKDLADLA